MVISDDGLGPAQRRELHTALLELQRQLHEVLADEAGLADTVHLDQAAVGRISRVDALQAQAMAKATQRRALQRLERVRAALERLAEDPEDFGVCPACGDDIGLGRLRAYPEAVFCVGCADRSARR
jgi:DnaK suppressor protein